MNKNLPIDLSGLSQAGPCHPLQQIVLFTCLQKQNNTEFNRILFLMISQYHLGYLRSGFEYFTSRFAIRAIPTQLGLVSSRTR